ncbi:MAG: hypothetical protein K0R10_1614 [Alphaproteobacteria bacterium]|jgi:hypothetical protein|nr:hypothetical protein [Alphaproteobacteria bacterium]
MTNYNANTDGYQAADNAAKIKQSAEALRGDVKKTVEHAKEGARYVADEAKVRANEYASTARDQIAETQDILVERIRNQPLQAGLAAFGAGFLLALLLKR